MSNLQIIQRNNIEVIDSRLVAENLEIQHKNLLETIKTHKNTIERHFGDVAFETESIKNSVGATHPTLIAYLTEDQSIFITTLSRNTEVVMNFKAELVKAFRKFRDLKPISNQFNLPQTKLEALKMLVEAEEKLLIALPKAEYTDKILTSTSRFVTTEIAKELGLTPNKLNKILLDLGIQYKVNGVWVLKAKYQDLEYTDTRTIPYYDSKGNLCTNHSMVWSEKGRNFIHNLLNKKLNN